MERTRLRRSKSAATIEGNAQNTKCKSVSKQSSDSYLLSDGFTKRNELGQNSFNGAGGKPIKKLLAEEMTKECEPKRKSPSIIARLMGLDGLPSPQHGHKQQRKASDKRQQNNASIGNHQTEQSVEVVSGRKSSVDQREFKDVYEDLEASNVSNRYYSSARVSDSRIKQFALEQVHQKNKQRLSSERVQFSKKSEDTLEVFDSVFMDKFHDFSPSSSLHGHGVEHQDNAKVWKLERDQECVFDISSRQKREDGLLLLPHNRHKSCKSCHPLENRFNAEIEKDMLPTTIVLLKPNLGKTGNSSAHVLSPRSSHTHPSSFKKHSECRRVKTDEAEKRRKKNSSNGLSFSKSKQGEDRELARAITRHMRESLGPFGHNLIFSAHSGVRGYAGDESSCDVNESDSSSGMEGMNISSRNSLDGTNCFYSSPSGPESSVGKEAKKRLSERWKMTRRCQDLQPTGKGGTLGEMLAVPDRVAARHEHLDAAVNPVCCTVPSVGSGYCSHGSSPLCISSKDGWKDDYIRNSSRSRSLPRYSSGSKVYKTNGQNETHIDDYFPLEKTNRGRSKSRRGNLGQYEDNALKTIKTCSRKPYPYCRKINDGSNTSLDLRIDEVETDISLDKQGEEKKEKLCLPSEGPAIPNLCLESDVNCESATMSSGSFVNLLCNQSGNMLQDHNSCADDQDAALKETSVGLSDKGSASLLSTEPEPEFSENSKEADHLSPVSVLGVSFAEDISSSSDCFETVSAELHELRMQLQLLKMESGNYGESASDEDVTQQAESSFHEKHVIFNGNSWQSTYIDDVLINSGLQTIDQDTFLSAWHSPDCPLDPWVFDIVEKNHWEDITVTKLDRRLLFDSMNSALLEAYQELVDPRPWARPILGGFISKWHNQCVKDVMQKFLVQQEKRWTIHRQENELDREMNWLRLEDCIAVVGKEMEELLVDDLIGELIA